MTISRPALAKKLAIGVDMSTFADTRGLYLENQIIFGTQTDQSSALFDGKTHDTSGSVFYRCVLAVDYDNPNTLTIECKFLTEPTYKSLCELGVRGLRGVDLSGVDLQGIDLQNTNLQRANLEAATLQGINLQEADLQYTNLQDADLRGADLRGADLYRARLRGANLQGANLQGATLWAASLEFANLQAANLQDANLEAANLESANLQGANLLGAVYDAFTYGLQGLTAEQLNDMQSTLEPDESVDDEDEDEY